MLRSWLVLLLACPLSAQVVSVKPALSPLTGAPGAVSVQAPVPSQGILLPSPAASLTPAISLGPIPVLAAPVPALAVVPLVAPTRAAPAIAPLRAAAGTIREGAPAVPAALSRLFDGAASVGEPSGPVAAARGPVRALESIKQLKVGSYNVLNLFESVGKHVPDPANPGKLKKISDAAPKAEQSLREQGRIILENDLDIVTLAEVENIAALRDFNARFLGGKYEVFLIEGNDERGIDVAFLVKKDLPFLVEQRSHKDETWVDPVLGGGPRPLFSRDLTALVVRAPGRVEPLFVLFGTHYKSKRDRDGDPESNILRAAQVRRSAEIITRYRAEFGPEVPVMLAGDFNGEVGKDEAFRPLFKAAGLMDGFDASPNPPSEKERITHTYHPRGAPAHFGQMDAVLVSENLRETVLKSEVYRYKNADGTPRALPQTYEERSRNPSDHFPVIVTLDFAPIRAVGEDARRKALGEARMTRIEAGTGMAPLGAVPTVELGKHIGGGGEGNVYLRKDDPSRALKVIFGNQDRVTRRLASTLNWLAGRGLAVEPVTLARLPTGRLVLEMRYFAPEDGWHLLSKLGGVVDEATYEAAIERAEGLMAEIRDEAYRLGVRADDVLYTKNVVLNVRTGEMKFFDPILTPAP